MCLSLHVLHVYVVWLCIQTAAASVIWGSHCQFLNCCLPPFYRCSAQYWHCVSISVTDPSWQEGVGNASIQHHSSKDSSCWQLVALSSAYLFINEAVITTDLLNNAVCLQAHWCLLMTILWQCGEILALLIFNEKKKQFLSSCPAVLT